MKMYGQTLYYKTVLLNLKYFVLSFLVLSVLFSILGISLKGKRRVIERDFKVRERDFHGLPN